jgi:hypothetical protein
VLGGMNREEFFSFCFLAVCSTRVPNINLLINIFMDDEGGPESALFLGSGGGSLIYLFYPARPLPQLQYRLRRRIIDIELPRSLFDD